MFLTCDDVGTKYRNELWRLDQLKEHNPKVKITCFAIAKDIENWFGDWYKPRKNWIEIGVHGYNHDYPPECEREDKDKRILKSLEILRSYLPEKFGFRAPGFQMTASTYPILQKNGFWFIAHQTRIQLLRHDQDFKQGSLLNTHIYEELNYGFTGNFKFISEGFNNIHS